MASSEAWKRMESDQDEREHRVVTACQIGLQQLVC